MLKLTIATLIGLSFSIAGAQTRCTDQINEAVRTAAAKDFAGQAVVFSIRDSGDADEETIATETVDVLDAGATSVLGTYVLTLNQTCHVISPVTLE